MSKLRMAPEGVVAFLERLGPGVLAVYEAGPTGFGLARNGRVSCPGFRGDLISRVWPSRKELRAHGKTKQVPR